MDSDQQQMASGQSGNRSASDLEAELSRCQTELQILRSSLDDSGARDRGLTELLDKVQCL
ncbi:testis-expressed sequence 9 protein-like [Tropilaelaps mercedesae]|uniref:Testis-expressed sequence 9 protein-like n=1 Tax=Tropilaelaps mercedesae TaxID=418985 RepID=A0A1V9X788_9ACAR|nr:testis-expressed sequence 9 protein-like [Tropilaelaps mercedesae]